jgi:GDP-4-dehydro-6-deoxy-D-mannose reductase
MFCVLSLENEVLVRLLITGANGFVGTHLVNYLAQNQRHHQLFGTTLFATPNTEHIQYHVIDLRDAEAVQALLAHLQPDAIVHLAGQASIDQSFKDVWGTFEGNLRPQVNLFQACLALNIRPKILIITSAEIYGKVRPQDLPLSEETPLRPANPYSVSKASQDLMAQQYYFSYQLPIIRARPFNHIGRGQSESFVATAFAMQIARIEAGLQDPIIKVGNLESQRDFTDVRDIVRAYHLLIEHGQAGEAYNIANGKSHSVHSLLNTLISFCNCPVDVVIDPERLRPIDVPVIAANAHKLHTTTQWQPTYSFEDTLREVLDDCRQRVQQLRSK